ncbi:DUF4249 domain-containing protein [Aquimarina sediminis]|uniref:DUF4249 domain-containing protein n=1 Tax=Aquimarina sediminis TaxID=2070536 RepID=UPI000CA03957|nr:DUF4249 domain-containing protein [Aquimarina sediminis]
MKTYIKIILTIIGISFTSCTDVIDVDVPDAPPRLVIEASLDWEKGTIGNNQTIKLTTSTKYFDKVINNDVTGASVKVTNDNNGTEFIFIDQNNGEYTTTNFVPVLNQSYTLEVIYNNEVYIAKETMMPVTDIAEVFQSIEEFDGDEILEVNLKYDDPEDEENYYFAKFRERGDLLPELYYDSDEFTNGNRMSLEYSKYEDEDINQDEFKPGDIVDIKLFGISKGYYNYISLLIDQAESDGGPFSTIPAPLKGNCTNTTKPSNYAFGYFRLTQVNTTSYTFQ